MLGALRPLLSLKQRLSLFEVLEITAWVSGGSVLVMREMTDLMVQEGGRLRGLENPRGPIGRAELSGTPWAHGRAQTGINDVGPDWPEVILVRQRSRRVGGGEKRVKWFQSGKHAGTKVGMTSSSDGKVFGDGCIEATSTNRGSRRRRGCVRRMRLLGQARPVQVRIE